MSMVEQFFSVQYGGRRDLFENQSIWQQEGYPNLQGTYPVLALSFAEVKASSFDQARKIICWLIQMLYKKYDFLLKSELLNDKEKKLSKRFPRIWKTMKPLWH